MFALVKNQTVTNLTTGEPEEVQTVNLFAPYTVWVDKNGTQHSPDVLLSLSADEKQDLGIYDVAYAARPDDRFYVVTEAAPEFDAVEKVVKINYTSTAKDLDDSGSAPFATLGLKTSWSNKFKDVANSILASSDWVVVRKIERNVDIPEAIATHRTAVVAESNRLETAIAAATTVEELITAVESAAFPSAE